MAVEIRDVDHRVGPIEAFGIVSFNTEILMQSSGDDAEASQMLGEIFTLKQRYEIKVEQIKANNIEHLEQRHEAAVKKYRRLMEEHKEVELNGAYLLARKRELDSSLSRAHLAMRMVQTEAPYAALALKSDVQAHQHKINEAQQAINTALRELQEHDTRVAQWNGAKQSLLAAVMEAKEDAADYHYRLNKAKGVKQEARLDRKTGLPLT